MKRRSCRRTTNEDQLHEKAVKMRKMTDEQLVHYVEDRVAKAHSEGYGEGKLIAKAEVAPVQQLEEIIDKIRMIKGIGEVKLKEIRKVLEER